MEALPLYSPLFSEHLLWYRTVLDVVGNKLEEKISAPVKVTFHGEKRGRVNLYV